MTILKSLGYSIANINLEFSVQPEWNFFTHRPFSHFSSGGPYHAHYKVFVNPSPVPPDGDLVFEAGQTWRMFAKSNRYYFWIGQRSFQPALVGNFSADYHEGQISISPSHADPQKYYFMLNHPLGELLMVSLLATGYGIMLHSCGVIDAGRGYVFAGFGRAGKSTTARLWNNEPGVRVINDDHTIVRKMDGQFRVYGTPWHGEGGFALADDAPVEKIFILKQAPVNQAIRLRPAQAVAALVARSFTPHWNAEGMAFTLQFLEDLCQTIPCYELGFVPDSSAVEYVRCLP